ncbi:MAG: hypothetical protein MI794_14570 [Pseudomonadales bacterium]|nr:hypothetical protein [Pseudomonadales bacterium]
MTSRLPLSLLFGLLLPGISLAQSYPHGLSDEPLVQPPPPRLAQALSQQRQSGPPPQGELSAQLHVDAQARLADSFRQPMAAPEPQSDQGSDGQ